MADLLVLWDVDYTLVDTGDAGSRLYRAVFAELFGGPPPPLPSMSGRTDRAIVLEWLTRAGIPEPSGQVSAFHAVLTARASQVAGLVQAHGRALPGAAAAIAALAGLAGLTGRAADGHASTAGRGSAGGMADRGAASTGPDSSEIASTAGRMHTAGHDDAGAEDRTSNQRSASSQSGASSGTLADGRADGSWSPGCLVQSLLTGNVPALAEVKLGALGLTEHLDLAVGAYGDASEVRADLVLVARQRAAQAYRCDFGGTATVLVGDTPLDVEAALTSGARAVAVATGRYSQAELTAAGAHAVLPDLTDTPHVLSVILGRPPHR